LFNRSQDVGFATSKLSGVASFLIVGLNKLELTIQSVSLQ